MTSLGAPKRTTVYGYLLNVPRQFGVFPPIGVPPSCVSEETAGKRGYEKKALATADICFDYLCAGQCSKGHECQYFHVDGSYVRYAIQADKCCHFHGDALSRQLSHDVPEILFSIDPLILAGYPICYDRLAMTAGLAKHRNDQPGEVCVEHSAGICSRGKDCSKLHVCRHILGILGSQFDIGKR